MITNSDLNISNQSYTKKDFYQIYPELTSLVKELTNAWNPEDTNESDPGVILLKIAAFVADKLNYNIDKNILEAFITSATQETSMKKLCDMLGYNMKYYNSATTTISFMWTGDVLAPENQPDIQWQITLPKFSTVITNEAKDINFILTEDVVLSNQYKTEEATAIQGELVKLDINDNGILLASNIDNKNRFYLPESQIAENGIWIYEYNSYITTEDSRHQVEWTRTENLNTEIAGKRVWKFGFDSDRQIPYIEFPSDYVKLFGNGLEVYYIRTSGNAGNIKAGTLNGLVNNQLVAENIYTYETKEVNAENNLIVKNLYATIDGCDMETLDEAYEGFKKTVGTFDTLVTCRDYANAIYNMIYNEKTDNTPLVSNCQVSDIRDELNYSTTVVKYTDLGKSYVNVADSDYVQTDAYYDKKGEHKVDDITYVKQPLITDFDLYLYPLNPIKNAYTKTTYMNSFKPLDPSNDDNYEHILENLRDNKTISHVIKQFAPNAEDAEDHLYLLKVYYSLKAKVITKNKVNNFEVQDIRNHIFTALWKNFNARKLEYGEEIPYDRLLSVMENADARIKAIALDEPTLSPCYMTAKGTEGSLSYTGNDKLSQKVYKKMITKNVLAGKIPLFDYNNDIVNDFYESNSSDANIYGAKDGNVYAQDSPDDPNVDLEKPVSITYFTSNLLLPKNLGDSGDEEVLKENEMIQIVTPKLMTEVTYPMYINYALQLNDPVNEKEQVRYISKNKNYTLETGEALYIQYTDDDEVVYWIKYTKNKKYTYKDKILVNTSDFSGIIYPNFDVCDTASLPEKGNKRTVTEGWPSDGNWTYLTASKGMVALKTSQELAIKTANSAAIKQKAYIYWLSNNNNTIILKQVGNSNVFEYILNDGEYFFYTNQAKTDLITLGSGTKLVYYATEEETSAARGSISWQLNSEQSITSDDVAQNGIGAFANSDWIVRHWTNDNYLATQQMSIVNLAESDVIDSWRFSDVSGDTVDSDWHNLESITYRLYDDVKKQYGSQITLESTDKIQYQLRTVLNLSCGPNKIQNLIKGRHELYLYTSGYIRYDNKKRFVDNDKIVGYLESEPEKLTEYIIDKTNKEIYKFDLNSNPTGFKTNIAVEKSGGTKISLHTINLNGTIKDNLLFYPLESMEPIEVVNEEKKTFNPYYGIALNEIDYALLPIYIPKDNYALLTIYVIKNSADESGAGGTGEPSIELDASDTALSLQLYPQITSSDTKYNKLPPLKSGLNIIKINRVDDLDIYNLKVKANGSTANINIFGVKLVNITSTGSASNEGFNTKLFGIDTADGETFFIDNNFKTDYADFYATVDIDPNMLIDVKSMNEPNILFNYNNEFNKFVLAELDCSSFENIEISSSSKI